MCDTVSLYSLKQVHTTVEITFHPMPRASFRGSIRDSGDYTRVSSRLPQISSSLSSNVLRLRTSSERNNLAHTATAAETSIPTVCLPVVLNAELSELYFSTYSGVPGYHTQYGQYGQCGQFGQYG